MAKVTGTPAEERAKLTVREVLDALRADNDRASESELQMYAAAFVEYRQAQADIDLHGVAVLHPRTGAPIANPSIPGRDAAIRLLRDRGFARLKTDALWRRYGAA